MHTTRLAALLTGALACTAVAGCGSGEPAAATATPAQRSHVTIDRPWVKAVDHGTTAVFGTLRNSAGGPARVTSATSTAAKAVVLHGAAMRPKKGGFGVPGNAEHELAPGGDHLMLMGVTEPIEPGDDIRVALVFRDGSRLTFTAPARSFSGAEETYRPGSDE